MKKRVKNMKWVFNIVIQQKVKLVSFASSNHILNLEKGKQ